MSEDNIKQVIYELKKDIKDVPLKHVFRFCEDTGSSLDVAAMKVHVATLTLTRTW